MRKTVIVRYGELALKSRWVRRHFEQRLCENIELILDGIDHKLERAHGRIFIDTKAPDEVAKRLVSVPGVVSVSSATKTEAIPRAIRSVAVEEAKKVLSSGSNFAVLTRRVGRHSFSSQDVNREVGAAILEAVPGTSVNLSTPDHKTFVEVRGNDSYIFFEVVGGIGGLPAGSQGKVVTLFSGGVNSFL
ncbi:MAG: THUMP domain-containing protein, partial [Candidatus Hadarchaeota archaeon]|nr:THUMP domain-containing protein [Candidatus Hadarchaeota archaeon]